MKSLMSAAVAAIIGSSSVVDAQDDPSTTNAGYPFTPSMYE